MADFVVTPPQVVQAESWYPGSIIARNYFTVNVSARDNYGRLARLSI